MKKPVQLFKGQDSIRARAILAGQRLNLKAFEIAPRIASSPLVVKAGSHGCAVLFRYGVAVLFDLDPVEEVAFLNDLRTVVQEPYEKTESDEAEIAIDPAATGAAAADGVIRLRECAVEHVQVIADALAKSVMLAYYESNVAASFDRVESMADELRRRGRTVRGTRELIRNIGHTLLIQSRMTGRVEIDDKPDVLWDRPDLERLYVMLETEYELGERHTALRRKLELIHQTAETLLGLLQDRRSFHLEWYIVILIVIEVIMSLADKFV